MRTKIDIIEKYLVKRGVLGLQYEVFAINMNSNNKFYGLQTCIEYVKEKIEYYRRFSLNGSSKSFIFNEIREITLGKNVNIIHSSSFLRSNLTTVKIDGNIEQISDGAFAECRLLSEFEFNKLHNCILEDNCFLKNKKLEKADLRGVIKLGKSSFRDCSKLTNVILSDCIDKIPERCFCGTNIENIDIPDGVVELGYDSLADTHNLKKMTLGKCMSRSSLMIYRSKSDIEFSLALMMSCSLTLTDKIEKDGRLELEFIHNT